MASTGMVPMGVEAAIKIGNPNTTVSGAGSGVVWGTGKVTDSGYRGTAFGQNTAASSNQATAFGDGTYARAHNATSFGVGTYADSRQATAFGSNTYAGTVFTYNGEVVTPVRRVIQRDVYGTGIEDDFVPKSMEPARDIDPMILAKPLTLFCNPKQTIEEAKKSAQQKSNELYTFVKLLDSNGKFVCNIYPTITAKEHAMRRGGRIRDEIYSKLQEREIGA